MQDIDFKYCVKCNRKKLKIGFSLCRNDNKDGLQRWCKKCMSTYKHKHQHTRVEYNSKYYRTNKYREKAKKRYLGLLKERKAHNLLSRAIDLGKITKPTICSQCTKEFPFQPSKIQGHHIDYNLPYFVMWVCQECHTSLHITPIYKT